MIAKTLLEGGDASGKYTWDSVLYHINKGDYATAYSTGDMIPLDLGSEGLINMQIAAFDSDDLADDNGKAHITFISKELLKTKHRMNPSRSGESGNYTEGTGGIGGWEKSEMRTYLNGTIKPLIPSNVRAAIKAVHKAHLACNSAESSFTQTTDDEVWLPSYDEIFSTSGSTNQPRYDSVFPDKASRVKTAIGASSASQWWLRSATSSSNFYYVGGSGNGTTIAASYSYGVALGFCM